MATNMLETLLEAALYLEEVDKMSSQSSEFSSSPTTTTSSTASSPSTSSPTVQLHRPPSSSPLSTAAGRRLSGSATQASWSVKMSSSSPTMNFPNVTAGGGGGGGVPSPQTMGNGGRQRTSLDSNAGAGQVVSTNQGQYPTAKAVSLSVANLPQQTAAIPLIIGGQHQSGGGVGAGGGVSISASTKYRQQQQPTTTLLNSINQTASVLGPGNGIQLTTTGVGSGGVGGITRIVHNGSGNILHLPSGTAAAAVNNSNGSAATTYSTLVRVNGNVDNMTEEQFENDGLPPSLVVISPQNFSTPQHEHQQQQQHHHPAAVSVAPASHHGQTISIVPAPPLSAATATTTTTIVGGREFSSNGTTGLDLSHVVHSTSGGALSSNQKSTNSFEMTTTNLSKSNLVNPKQSSSVFVNRKGYPGLDLVHTSSSSVIGGGSYQLVGSENNCGPPLPPPPTSTTTIESIMKSTNLAGKTQPLLANGLLGATVGSALHFQQQGLPMAAAADKPEDLSSHLTFNLSSLNGYSVGGDSVNMISKTTGTTLVGGSKPIINLGDLSIDPQQLQEIQQQQSLYQSVYQKGVMTPASATSSGRRRTTSNNSTGGSQRSPSSMRSGTRESHNKLEKNRRAQMRTCFDTLKKQLPKGQEEKKTSNLSILSSALNYIITLKRTDKEWEHEQERLVKEKIRLQNKLASLKREMASQLDKDPALASLVAGDIQRSVRTSESGADEASSMDGYPSNGDETDSFRGSAGHTNTGDRSLSPMVTVNGNKVHMLGDQVSVELKSRDQLTITQQSSATILAVPNLNQVNLSTATSQMPLTAINLSSTANPINHHVPKNGILNIPSSVGSAGAIQQIITNSSSPSFVHTMSNGQHVIMKGGNNGFANKGNGLIIREAIPPQTSTSVKFGNTGDMFDAASPAIIHNLMNGSAIGPNLTTFGTSADLSMTTTTTTTTALPQQQQQQHTQVLPIYKSTQNGGLRVIGHHTTTTTSTPNGGGSSLAAPSVVFSNEVTSKYQQHLPSGMVISGASMPANLSQPYMSNGSTGITTTTFGGVNNAAQVHKLLLTGMPPNMTAQNVSTGGYPLPQIAQSSSGDFYARGSTSLPGGAQLNVCRSPSSTPSPTISITASTKGNGMKQKGGRGSAGAQFGNVAMVNGGGSGGAGVLASKTGGPGPQIVSKVVVDANWHTNAASQHPYVPFQMISSVPTSLPVVSATGSVLTSHAAADVKVSATGPKKRAANGAGSARGAKRKSAGTVASAMAPTSIMITPQTSMETVKNNPPTTMMIGKGFGATTSMANESSSGKVGSVTLTTTNFKPTIK